MTKLISDFRALVGDRKGVTAMEYGLIAALVAVVIIIAVRAVGVDLAAIFQRISTALQSV